MTAIAHVFLSSQGEKIGTYPSINCFSFWLFFFFWITELQQLVCAVKDQFNCVSTAYLVLSANWL